MLGDGLARVNYASPKKFGGETLGALSRFLLRPAEPDFEGQVRGRFGRSFFRHRFRASRLARTTWTEQRDHRHLLLSASQAGQRSTVPIVFRPNNKPLYNRR
jgi:hypothetical protein